MKKRYLISQRKCEQGLVAFYGYVAEMCNIEITSVWPQSKSHR